MGRAISHQIINLCSLICYVKALRFSSWFCNEQSRRW